MDQRGTEDATKSDAATCWTVRNIIDSIPYEAQPIDVALPGLVVREWREPTGLYYGQAWYTYYPSVAEYQLRRPVATLFRSQLEVKTRLNYGTDIVRVSRPPFRTTGLFRYQPHAPRYGGVWAEIHILSQLPYEHPYILPLNYLVVEEISGLGVVGFVARLPPVFASIQHTSLTVKLKWLKQLMSVVDELHVDYGIVHQHIVAQNVLINRDTDCAMLFNFGRATGTGRLNRNGYCEELAEQNDIKAVVILAYYLVTRDPEYVSYDLKSIVAGSAVRRER